MLTLLLVLALTVPTLPAAPAAALSFPWRSRPMERQPAAPTGVLAPLQEVSPPEAVQQLQSALGSRQPVVEIVSPQADSVLPAGPWTLRLRVHDWPLVDGGPLGMGPHLVVQLDQEPPRIWTRSEGVMPELGPGSHRLTVYAALPWGEARKDPGAAAQIRLHRSAANPLSLPAPGSPQLLAVSPSGTAGEEPLLLDWLLLEAPLQDVGGSGTQWRLRVTINGDAFLLDQQSALWLRGWRAGANALQLELLDGRGEPLNPPFNSLVQNVDLNREATRPRWRGGLLSPAELAILLGEAPPPAQPEPPLPAAAAPSPATPTSVASGRSPTTPGSDAAVVSMLPEATSNENAGIDVMTLAAGQRPALLPASQAGAEPAGNQGAPSQAPMPEASPARSPDAVHQAATEPAETTTAETTEAAPAAPAGQTPWPSAGATDDRIRAGRPDRDDPDGRAGSAGSSTARTAAAPAATTPATGASEPPVTERSSLTAPFPSAATGAEPARQAPATSGSTTGSMVPADAAAPHPSDPSMTTTSSPSAPSADPPADALPAPTQHPPEDPVQVQTSDAERVRPTTSLGGRARDLVNEDGTPRRPQRRGPLAGLRERLQR